MSSLDIKKIEKIVRTAALENAVKHSGKAQQGAIIGKLLAQKPELKKNMSEISPLIKSILDDVNSLSQDEQKKQLLESMPDFVEAEKKLKAKRKKEARELPPLKDAEEGKVVTRIPPGPSKYPHIGHAVSFGINYLYGKEYSGRCILRFDDTNPEVEKQEFVNAIKEDVIEYLGFEPAETVYASDYMDRFYAYVESLIEKKNVYACSCPSESIAESRRDMKECVHRDQDSSETKRIWNEMKKGKFSEYALRLRIDMGHKNAVMRDPVMFRVVGASHYRQKSKYKVWPTYDFESPVVDGMNGITHVLRSNEFDTRIELHHHIASLLGFHEAIYKPYGRVNITGSLT